MKTKFILIAVLILAGFLVFGGYWLYSNADENRSIENDIFCGGILFLSFLVALYAYWIARKNDEYQIAEKRREVFITDESFQKIRMLIEHNDIKLQTVLAITEIMQARKPGLLTDEGMILHEEFDDYLNIMESVAILANSGSMSKDAREGLWSYYFKSLRKAHMLDFDNANHPVLKRDIFDCIDTFYEGDSTKIEMIKMEFEKYIPNEKRIADENVLNKFVPDPIEQEYELKEISKINPVIRPIWYYINIPGYEFKPTLKLLNKLYAKDKNHRELSKDGFE